MIQSIRNNCLFIRIPRTASTSICAATDTHVLHWSCKTWIERIGREKYDEMFVYSIVRNPYDRFLSCFYEVNKHREDVQDYLKPFIKNLKFLGDPFYRPMYEYLDDRVDYIGRFENLPGAWAVIRDKTGVDPNKGISLLRRNVHTKQELSDELKEIIYRHYKKDFLNYDYKE